MTEAPKRKKVLIVTDHAMYRYMERTECKDSDKARNNLLSLAGNAKPVVMKRLQNGDVFLFPSDEFCSGKWVLVIKDESIITCFKAGKDKYLTKPRQP
jgi:hypothetical protein